MGVRAAQVTTSCDSTKVRKSSQKMSRQLHIKAALTAKLRIEPDSVESWVDPRACLDRLDGVLAKRKIIALSQHSNPVVEPAATRVYLSKVLAVTVCTTCSRISETLHFVHTVYLFVPYGSHSKQHQPVGLCSGDAMCFP
jgi:hypothetical protein